MSIRKVKRSDIEVIAKLNRIAFSKEPYNTRYSVKESIDSIKKDISKGECYVYEISGKVMGFIIITKEILDKNYIFIENLVVDSKKHRKGIGKELVGYVEDKNPKNSIITLITNRKSNAYKFYKELGYKENKVNVNMSKKLN